MVRLYADLPGESLSDDQACSHDSDADAQEHGRELPHWNSESGELSFAGRLVKLIPERATSERSVLAAFQASGWVDSLKNPLICKKKDLAQHLRDTARSLNTSQEEYLLEFAATDRGTRIIWRAVE